VLSMAEAPFHPHNVARSSFFERDGVTQPAPAPRFSATPAEAHAPAPLRGEHTKTFLREAGFAEAEIAELTKE